MRSHRGVGLPRRDARPALRRDRADGPERRRRSATSCASSATSTARRSRTARASPRAAPSTINAGQVVDCGQVTSDFEVKGNNAFGVFSGMLGGQLVDPSRRRGRPVAELRRRRRAVPHGVHLPRADRLRHQLRRHRRPARARNVAGRRRDRSRASPPIGSNGFGVARYKLGAGQRRRAHAHRRTSPSASRSWATASTRATSTRAARTSPRSRRLP